MNCQKFTFDIRITFNIRYFKTFISDYHFKQSTFPPLLLVFEVLDLGTDDFSDFLVSSLILLI